MTDFPFLQPGDAEWLSLPMDLVPAFAPKWDAEAEAWDRWNDPARPEKTVLVTVSISGSIPELRAVVERVQYNIAALQHFVQGGFNVVVPCVDPYRIPR